MCGDSDARTLGRRLNCHQGLRPRRLVGVATTVVECLTCRLIYANPRPVPVAFAQHYDRAPEQYWAPSYFAQAAGYFDASAASFRRLWGGSTTPRALDVGAGIGKAMASLELNGFDAFGLEPSPAFRDAAIANGVQPGRLQLATIEDAVYEPRSFDLISFGAVLEHLHDPAAALERAVSWVAPGGLIFVEVPSARWLLARLLNLAYRLRGLDYVTHLSPMHQPFHLYEFTPQCFERHARRAAYEVVEQRFLPCESFMPKPADRFARRIMAATGTGMQLELWLRPRRG
jgi:SAM-dependent methyltransferase